MGILVIEMIDTSPPYMEDEYYARAPLQVSESTTQNKLFTLIGCGILRK